MPHPREFSESTAREIDCAVRELVEGAYQKALAILRGRREVLEKGAALLLEHETLSEAELKALAGGPVAAR
jgi:cell division protease FtsH